MRSTFLVVGITAVALGGLLALGCGGEAASSETSTEIPAGQQERRLPRVPSDGGTTTVEQPGSMAEARAMGDPAASAPTAPMPEVTIYKGEEIDEETVVELGLACMQTPKAYICKDSTDEFEGG